MFPYVVVYELGRVVGVVLQHELLLLLGEKERRAVVGTSAAKDDDEVAHPTHGVAASAVRTNAWQLDATPDPPEGTSEFGESERNRSLP